MDSCHQTHLLGHVLAQVLKRLTPQASLAQSANLGSQFWVKYWIEPSEIPQAAQIEQEMRKIINTSRNFSHKTIDLDHLESLFPGQVLKQEEGHRLSQDSKTVAAYQLDEMVDFCNCQNKRLQDFQSLQNCRWSALDWQRSPEGLIAVAQRC